MKLRNRNSYITSLPEGSPPKNIRPYITQIIYYAILLFVVGYVIYIFSSRFFYFKETGFVEVNKTIISASHGGKLLTLTVKEDQHFNKKKLLAIIAAAKNCGTTRNTYYTKLKYDLALNRSRLSLLKRAIKVIRNNLATLNLQRALETGQARESTNHKLKLNLLKKQNEAALLESQIILQRQQLKNTNPIAVNSTSADCFKENIYAPFNGRVLYLQRKVNEFTQRGAPLITIVADDADVRIETYLETDQLPYLKVGHIVDITFADNIKTQAKIKAINSSAYSVPEREWNYYKPADTQVRIHLEPLNKRDAALWKKYDRMEVTVRGRK